MQAIKFAVFSDIHGNLLGLKPALEQCIKEGITRFLFLGDYVNYQPLSIEVVQYLREFSERFSCTFIKGNHDEAVATGEFSEFNYHAQQSGLWCRKHFEANYPEGLEWLKSLPTTARLLELPVILVHGGLTKRPNAEIHTYMFPIESIHENQVLSFWSGDGTPWEEHFDNMAEQKVSVCFLGHTHLRFAASVKTKKPLILNLGAEDACEEYFVLENPVNRDLKARTTLQKSFILDNTLHTFNPGGMSRGYDYPGFLPYIIAEMKDSRHINIKWRLQEFAISELVDALEKTMRANLYGLALDDTIKKLGKRILSGR